MRVEATTLPDVLLVTRNQYDDHRGWFTELYNAAELKSTGFDISFVQDNLSYSKAGVIRGLHYQVNPAQGKLVTCLTGRILDVAVDIRYGSNTFGQHVAVELGDGLGRSLWIPAGFAHGFAVLGKESAAVLYKVDQHRSAQGEGGILWSDPDLAIPWSITGAIVSERDAALPTFAEYTANQPE